MNSIVAKLKHKLNSKAGESIGEALISLLIGALALTMLAGAVSASFSMIRNNRERLKAYYASANNLVTFEGATNLKDGITISGDGFDAEIPAKYTVSYVKNASFSKTPVVSYKKNN